MKKYISLWVGIALLISPVLASAQTVGSLQTELQSLEAEIAALQAQGTTTASGPISAPNEQTCVDLTFAGGVGTTSNQVLSLQTFLGINPATGYFGTKTQGALTAWQSAHGISATGYFGALTRAAMACSNQTSATVSSDTNTQNVEENLNQIQSAEAAFNVNALNEMVLYVNEANAYSGTNIPNLKAVANQWGPMLLSMQSQLQTLQQSNLTTISSSDLALTIAAYMQSGSGFNQALAAFNALPSSELATLGTNRVSTTSNPSCVSPTILLPTANGGVTITPGQQTGKLLQANQPVTWSVQNLPSWATLNTTNGVDATTGLSSSQTTIQYGPSSTPGTYTMTVVATNSCGAQASVPFTVNVFGVISTTPVTTAAVPYPVSLSPSQGTVGTLTAQ